MTKNQTQPDEDPPLGSLGAVGAADLDVSVALVAGRDPQLPGVAAHLAVLNERAADLRLEVNLDVFTTIRAGHDEHGLHGYMMRHRRPGGTSYAWVD